MNVLPSEFEKQLRWLRNSYRNSYRVISLDEGVRSLKDGELPSSPSVAITFDDGYENNYRVAYPILKKMELPATVFLLTAEGEQGRRTTHLEGNPLQGSRYLSWEEVKEMEQSNIHFGSHGETHTQLKDLPLEPLRREISVSKQKIEKELQGSVRFFSYPYGTFKDFDRRAAALVQEAGYDAACSAVFGMNGLKSNPFALRRIGIEASDTLFTLRAKLNGALSLLALFSWSPVRFLIRWFDAAFLKTKLASREKKKKSPLLLVSVDFPPHTDGVSTISQELSRRIAFEGEPLLSIGPRDHGDKEFDARQPYKTFRVPGYSWGYLRFIPILFCMPFVVLAYRVRKVFAMNIAYGGLLSWVLSHFISLEYLIFAYGFEFEKVKRNRFLRNLYLKIYDRAKTIITCSENVRQRLIAFGVNAEKVKVLYPAVHLDRFRPCDVPQPFIEEKGLKNRRVILTVGRLIERKGHDQVLKAMPQVIHQFPDILYCIVGIGPNREHLQNLARELKLENHVKFLGKVRNEELPYLYNLCEFFIMPSREMDQEGHVEGFGIVYLEANACGKPVMGGRSGGVGEAIREDETGLLVDPNNTHDIAEKMISLLSDPEKRKEMGKAGLKWVQESFDWNQYTKQAYRYLCPSDEVKV